MNSSLLFSVCCFTLVTGYYVYPIFFNLISNKDDIDDDIDDDNTYDDKEDDIEDDIEEDIEEIGRAHV